MQLSWQSDFILSKKRSGMMSHSSLAIVMPRMGEGSMLRLRAVEIRKSLSMTTLWEWVSRLPAASFTAFPIMMARVAWRKPMAWAALSASPMKLP